MKRKARKCHAHCKAGRHVFTREECQLGYQRAIESIVKRVPPDWTCKHGAHISHCFLRAKNPLYFEARRLKRRIQKLEKRLGQNNKDIRLLKAQAAQLEAQAKHTTKPGKRGSNVRDNTARLQNQR